jgi:FMN-dependent NADH-azoreductase
LENFTKSHSDWVIDTLDLTKDNLPVLTMKRVDGKYVLLDGKELYGELKEAWQDIISNIDRFKSADGYLITTPMWNFSIPYFLKQYIDIIIQPKFLFRYTHSGVEGLVKNKKMIVITSRGGDYKISGPYSADLQQPYLRTIFGFVGLTEMDFVIAQPMDTNPDIRKSKLQEAKEEAAKFASNYF